MRMNLLPDEAPVTNATFPASLFDILFIWVDIGRKLMDKP